MYIGFWALKLVCTQYGLCNPQECKNNLYYILFKSGRADIVFQLGSEKGFMELPKGCWLWALALSYHGTPSLKSSLGVL